MWNKIFSEPAADGSYIIYYIIVTTRRRQSQKKTYTALAPSTLAKNCPQDLFEIKEFSVKSGSPVNITGFYTSL